jgi:signal recognition particle receptor subunit beta
MPVFIAKFESCDCTPSPDMVVRADDMVSAVMKCQETLEKIHTMAAGSKVDLHDAPTISAIEEMFGMELMDEEGISDVVGFWKDVVKS